MIRIAQGYALSNGAHASMFEDRRRLFVELMGWDLPVTANGHEIDRYDGADSVYVVDVDDGGGHRGSLRLLPTDRPHLLGELFRELVEGELPCGPDVFEITRLCLPTRLGAAQRLHVRNRLISAMVDHCLEAGVRTLTGFVVPGFRAQILAMGWEAEALGPARAVGGMALGAFCIDLDRDTPERLALNGIYTAGTIAADAAVRQAVSA